jgi:hypothetical protein
MSSKDDKLMLGMTILAGIFLLILHVNIFAFPNNIFLRHMVIIFYMLYVYYEYKKHLSS